MQWHRHHDLRQPNAAVNHDSQADAYADGFRLTSSCLLSKWGFSDGTLDEDVNDWLDQHAPGIYPEVDDKTVIVDLVREYLLPVLDQDVEVVELQTSHNPIRAKRVDGVDVEECWTSTSAPEPTLTPEHVVVPMPAVLATIRRHLAPERVGHLRRLYPDAPSERH